MMAADLRVGTFSSSYSLFPSPPRLLPIKLKSYSKGSTPSTTASMSEDPITKWITQEGKATKITRISPVGGGCINFAYRYDTDAGSFFVKTNRHSHLFFDELKPLV
ncbi:hypothetical protein C5167_032203 [Papaver somniferum]|uniref:protein-ribulosamine 3-kinase n=1 Tax=Papaver somniferum TaxID=3469 RepID=A0A4Y7KAU9_PAPSO|nr:hypothetical protein C5167_032203 [Papaver somniferum]